VSRRTALTCAPLGGYVAVLYAVHLGVMMGAWALQKGRWSLEETLLASNANIGGPATASAFAVAKGARCEPETQCVCVAESATCVSSTSVSVQRRRAERWWSVWTYGGKGVWLKGGGGVEVCGTGWERLVTPALLVGSLGQIIATFLGLTVGTLVLQHL